MMKALVPLALALAAGSAIACPGADKSMDAKADTRSSPVAASLAAATQQSKAETDKKLAKAAEARKPKS